MDNYNYPEGSDTNKAPWNDVDNSEREIEVTVSITLSKTVKIKVDDYKIVDCGIDEDGDCFEDVDFSEYALNKAVKEQMVLPQDLAEYTTRMFGYDLNLKAVGMPKYLETAISDCEDWNVDDFAVVLEK